MFRSCRRIRYISAAHSLRWEVTGTEIDIGESSRDKGNVELSAAKKEVEVAAENKMNNNEVLLGGKHHGLLFSDRLMDRVAAGGGAVNLTWLLDSLLIKQKRIDFMDTLLLYCRLLPSQSIKKINSIMGFSVVLKSHRCRPSESGNSSPNADHLYCQLEVWTCSLSIYLVICMYL